MNGSRPQTVAAGLSDSPVGQLAYSELFESFGNGTSPGHARAGAGAGDALLADQHGAPARSATTTRRRARRQPSRWSAPGRLGVAVFKDDFQTIRSLAERDNANIQHWSEFDRGGHFAALENPDAIVADLRAFFGAAG